MLGCHGSTDLVAAAIDKAMDPNGDGDTSDHVDVINLSLGSDFTSPQDGDAIAVEDAVKAGITVVAASGNAGDLFDAGGSPGNVSSALTVAASTDDYAQLDSLNMSSPGTTGYGAERSAAYDWAAKRDLSGTVARVSSPSDLDACDPLSAADARAVRGRIAFVEWTDDDATRRCGSAARAANLVAAGATGFIYADDSESFSGAITGSTSIPGVLVTRSAGAALRTALLDHSIVVVASTTPNGFRQLLSGHDDLVAGFSSRGIGDGGNVKPDLAAVGESVFSIGSDTGDGGASDSGTSMATPMVAGAAALVDSRHPDWTPEQVKADLMDTADQDLYTGPDHTGTTYAPQRVGARPHRRRECPGQRSPRLCRRHPGRGLGIVRPGPCDRPGEVDQDDQGRQHHARHGGLRRLPRFTHRDAGGRHHRVPGLGESAAKVDPGRHGHAGRRSGEPDQDPRPHTGTDPGAGSRGSTRAISAAWWS